MQFVTFLISALYDTCTENKFAENVCTGVFRDVLSDLIDLFRISPLPETAKRHERAIKFNNMSEFHAIDEYLVNIVKIPFCVLGKPTPHYSKHKKRHILGVLCSQDIHRTLLSTDIFQSIDSLHIIAFEMR